MGKKKIALFVLIFCFVLVTTLPASAQITWEQINSSGFGKPNTRASGLTVFEERLCVGTINQTDGVQVLRYDSNTTWTQVNEDGFGEIITQHKVLECLMEICTLGRPTFPQVAKCGAMTVAPPGHRSM